MLFGCSQKIAKSHGEAQHDLCHGSHNVTVYVHGQGEVTLFAPNHDDGVLLTRGRSEIVSKYSASIKGPGPFAFAISTKASTRFPALTAMVIIDNILYDLTGTPESNFRILDDANLIDSVPKRFWLNPSGSSNEPFLATIAEHSEFVDPCEPPFPVGGDDEETRERMVSFDAAGEMAQIVGGVGEPRPVWKRAPECSFRKGEKVVVFLRVVPPACQGEEELRKVVGVHGVAGDAAKIAAGLANAESTQKPRLARETYHQKDYYYNEEAYHHYKENYYYDDDKEAYYDHKEDYDDDDDEEAYHDHKEDYDDDEEAYHHYKKDYYNDGEEDHHDHKEDYDDDDEEAYYNDKEDYYDDEEAYYYHQEDYYDDDKEAYHDHKEDNDDDDEEAYYNDKEDYYDDKEAYNHHKEDNDDDKEDYHEQWVQFEAVELFQEDNYD
ncbi:hypothetical protein HDU97_005623, partial [Phlyctochytrium planicorne]